MKVKHITIPSDVMTILHKCAIDAHSVKLPSGRLERKLYEAVNKILAAAGGKWNKKAQAHLFESDPREALGMALETGKVVNHKQTYQFFPTPKELAARVISLADIEDGMHVLEPSAGDGALIEAIRDVVHHCKVVAVELEPERAKDLKAKYSLAVVLESDFLDCNCLLGMFDRIVMNPPFTAGQDVEHVNHARTFLKPGGRLVGICSASERSREALQPIASHWEELEAGTFAGAGTQVRTVLFVIEG